MPTGLYLRTEKTKRALRKAHVGMTGKKHSNTTITKMSVAKLGVKYPNRKSPTAFSFEHIYNLSQAKLGNTNCIGCIPWNKGMQIARKLNTYYNRISKSEGIHTEKEWEELKKRYNYKCSVCGAKDSERKLTKDHIRPLSKGGSNFIENIQPLCRSCNSKKYNIILLVNRPPKICAF